MALGSAARVPISRGMVAFDSVNSNQVLPLLWAGFLTLLLAGPWLAPGYLFGTDWPGPRRIPFPTDVSSSAPLQWLLATASSLIGGEATGKLFVCTFIFVGAVLAYRAVPAQGFVAGAVAATVFTVNPFVYGRLHYGQLYLLAGYAVLPWVAISLRTLCVDPSIKTGLLAAISFALLGVMSPHLLLIAGVLAAAVAVAYVVAANARLRFSRRLARGLLVTAGVSLVVSAYWVVPLLVGRGYEGGVIAGTGTGQLNAYAAVPDAHLGLLPNLLGLYGFWAENSGRFASMKDFVQLWPAVVVALLLICAVGLVAAFKQREDQIAPWAAGLVAAAVIAVVLEMGVSHPLTAGLVSWLDAHFTLYRGLRDAGKWAALLALIYSQLAGLGAVAVLAWLRKRATGPSRSEWIVSGAGGLLLALPLYYGNGLLYGAHGEIKPSQYPPGWYAAERVLAADPHAGRAVFLPWHLYMAYSFIQNQNKVVAPPAPSFFSAPVLVSTNPEVAGIAAPTDPDQVAISNLVGAGREGNWSAVLTAFNIKYVLLAREVDWASFAYLDNQAGLVKVGDFGSIVIYRNIALSQTSVLRGP